MFTCVTNRNFKLLNEIQFDNFAYHHYHTFVFNVLPFILMSILNIMISFTLHERNCRDKQRLGARISGNFCDAATGCDIGREKKILSFIRMNFSMVSLKKRNFRPNIVRAREKGIFFSLNDVTYRSVLVSFVHCVLTVPNNLLSYLAEWNSDLLERVYFLTLDTRHENDSQLGSKLF